MFGIAFAIFSAMLHLACAPAKGPETVLKPLEERRARAIIEDAIRRAGMEPTPPKVITLKRQEAKLSEDMRIGVDNFLKNGPRAKAEFVHR